MPLINKLIVIARDLVGDTGLLVIALVIGGRFVWRLTRAVYRTFRASYDYYACCREQRREMEIDRELRRLHARQLREESALSRTGMAPVVRGARRAPVRGSASGGNEAA